MKLNVFKDKQFNKELLKLALPIAFQNLMLASVAAADAFMLGAIDQNSMSAVSLATQIQFMQNMIIYAFVTAITALGAQYYGKGDNENVVNIICIGLKINAFVSIATFVGTEFFPRQLMTIFTNDELLIDIGSRYLKISAWSYLMTGISQTYLAMLKIENKAKHVALISTVTVIVNIFLNSVLIFGLFSFPKLEEQGAAYATLISRIIELVWCVILSFMPGNLRPTIKAVSRYSKRLYKDFYKCSLPLLGSSLLWGVGFTAYSAFMGHLGQDATAANSLAAVIRDLVCCLCNGLASGGGILLGYKLGAGELEKGKECGQKLLVMSFIFGFLSTIIMLVLIPIILPFVKLTSEASKLFVYMMIIMSIYMIGRTVNTIVINGVFDSGGDTLFDLYSLVITMWCLAVPLAFLGTFVFKWNPIVVYAMTCLDEVGKIPWVVYHFKKYKWVRDLTIKEDKI